MSERLTIADSKKAFHKAFPHVIPPIYRRVTDELLVELHLLSHQKAFKADLIFAIGLNKVFDTFTRGYRPEKHLGPLFEALCKSNGLDPVLLRDQSEKTLQSIKGHKLEEIASWLKNKGIGAPEKLEVQLELLSKGESVYSRLISIGLLTVLKEAEKEKEDEKYQELINDVIKDTSKLFGFSQNRVERDLNQFNTNIEKISQALEVMKEAIEHDRKKKNSNLKSNKEEVIEENKNN